MRPAAIRFRKQGLATTYQIFATAERIEEISAETYRLLAEQLADEPGARALFRRLAEEELQHAQRVRLLASRYRHDSRLLGAVSAAALDEVLAEAEATLAAVQRGGFARTLAEARQKLAEVEARSSRAHAELIASEGHPALREFFRRLAAQDRAHQEFLSGR